MSEAEKFLEKFLERWSRRKLAAAERAGDKPPDEPDSEPPSKPETAATNAPSAAARNRTAPQFDPATLPPLELINAASDIQAFLAPGVPVELTRAALRRAWLADPAIRDFIGIAENQWDFTRPDGVPGFGALDLSADLRRVLSELSGVPEHEGVAQTEQAAEKTEEETPPPHGCDVAAAGERRSFRESIRRLLSRPSTMMLHCKMVRRRNRTDRLANVGMAAPYPNSHSLIALGY